MSLAGLVSLRFWALPGRLISLALFLVFLLVVAEGATYPPEARLFPTMVGVAGMVLALAVFLVHGGGADSDAEAATSEDLSAAPPDAAPPSRGRVLLAVAAAPVYALVVWVLGFYVASLLALVVLPQCLGYRRVGMLTLIAALGVALIAVVFSWGMEMTLPNGLVGDWVLATFVYDR
jgi:hypothetical protein